MADMLNLNMKLNPEYLKDSVNDVVQSAIISALGDPEKLVAGAINNIVGSYVNKEGKPCDRNYWGARSYLDYLAEQTVKETVKDCISKSINKNKKQFTEAIFKQLNKSEFRDKVASSFLQQILSCAESTWHMPISVSFEGEEGE